ncbi:MAG: hypothetical protein LUD18_03880 [Lachnospiraceae bacterium]|nr:hypothetical protein [Lachnospiraceae bacterium]
MKLYNPFPEGDYKGTHEMIRLIRLSGESDGNIVQRLELELLSESAAVDISIVTGLEAEEVLLVVECLRHFEFIQRLAEEERAEAPEHFVPALMMGQRIQQLIKEKQE